MKSNLFYSFFDRKNFIYIFFAFCVFLLNQPYFVWEFDKLQLVMFLPIVFVSFFYIKKTNNKDLFISFLFFYILMYMAGGRNVFGYINNLLFLIFLLISEKLMVQSFFWFKNIFVFFLILSLSVYFLVLFLAVPFSYNIIKPLNTIKLYDYVQYPFLVSQGILSFARFNIRFDGVFDEPGVIGSIATILLFTDNYNLKSKQNIILFIAGLFSFSFYFIISSLFYFFVFRKTKIRILAIIIFGALYFSTINNNVISLFLWDRFSIEDNQLKGDNRSNINLDMEFDKFLKSDDILWGQGFYSTQKSELITASSYKSVIIGYGFIFFFILLLAFFLLAYFNIKDKKQLAIFMFMFLGMMYQRPGMIYFPGSFFLLIASIFVIKNNIVVQNNIAIPSKSTQ